MVSRIFALLALACLALAGCGDLGKIEQGRVVAYDKDKKLVTFLPNSEIDPRKTPKYAAPPLTFAIPADPAEMGREPKSGKLRVNINVEKKTISMYNPQTRAIEDFSFELVENHTGVNVRRQHPLVYDAAARKARSFPQVDAAKKTVTAYSAHQQMLTVMKFSDADFAKYKGDEWGAGDEVRIFYKEPGKSLRLMNVTQTDIMRRR
jgi:hypothetical protein